MLSYRHAYHAGNHADVFKHFVVYLVLRYFNQKDTPYWYIDTHSGAGLYDLRTDHAQKIAEHQQGIAKLSAANHTQWPDALQDFWQHLHTHLDLNTHYCGSPWLANSLMRPNDKLRLFELHPNDFITLNNTMRQAANHIKRRYTLHQEDGHQGLLALLPPAPRRAVTLIDPSYENKHEYTQTVHTLKAALEKFPQGCYLVWYPCLSRTQSQQLPEKLRRLMPDNFVCAQIHVHRPRDDGFGMHGSGMFVINPPYVLAQELQHNLPTLTALLAQDRHARFSLTHHIR